MPHTCKYPTRQQSSSRLPPWLMCIADWLISDKRRPSQWATRKRQLCRYLKTVASNTTWLRPIFYLFYKSKHGKWTIKVSNHPGLPLLFFAGTYINSRYMFKWMSRYVSGTEAKAHGVCTMFFCLPVSLLSFMVFTFLLSSFLVPWNKILLICPMWKYIQERTFENN